jgi:protein tyrosine phosphatase (PTP) superfamily phosphohydrolase (DUF442 family)
MLWLLAGALIVFAGSVPSLGQTAQEESAINSEDLPDYREVASNVGTGGQPTEAGMRLLARKGYRAVVNLRYADEKGSLPSEEVLARELGMKYFNIPVGKTPEERQAREFLELMGGMEYEKVFVHCATANRVGSFMLIERVIHHDWTIERAAEEAARIGLRSETLRNFAMEFVKKYRKQ